MVSLHVRQTKGRTVLDDRAFDPPQGISDADFLAAKATSAEANGWAVKWIGTDRFEARKTRWGGVAVKRVFWVE